MAISSLERRGIRIVAPDVPEAPIPIQIVSVVVPDTGVDRDALPGPETERVECVDVVPPLSSSRKTCEGDCGASCVLEDHELLVQTGVLVRVDSRRVVLNPRDLDPSS
jgi:hypothetical protein